MKKVFNPLIVSLITMLFAFTTFYGMGYSQDASGTGGVGGRPAYPREDNPRSQSIFVHTINPGESVTDGIQIINNSGEEKTILIYGTDSVKSSDGAFACAQKVDPKNDVGSWVKMKKNQVTLASSATEVVDFEILLPDNVDVGEHSGCIVVQEKQPDAIVQNGIGLSFRTAVRVAILVPGDIIKNLQFESLGIEQQGNDIIATPFVQNTGNVSVDATINTKLINSWGDTVSETGGQFPVLRTSTSSWNFKHQKPFWGGWYKIDASAAYDDNVSNFIGDSQETKKVITYTSSTLFIKPQPKAMALYLLAVTALIAVVMYAFIKRRTNKKILNKWQEVAVSEGKNIKDYAKERDVNWKQIAKVNKLKPPYDLNKDQKILLPPKEKVEK